MREERWRALRHYSRSGRDDCLIHITNIWAQRDHSVGSQDDHRLIMGRQPSDPRKATAHFMDRKRESIPGFSDIVAWSQNTVIPSRVSTVQAKEDHSMVPRRSLSDPKEMTAWSEEDHCLVRRSREIYSILGPDPREQSDPIETTHCQSPGRTLLDPKKTTVWNQRDHCLIKDWSLPHPIVWTQVDHCLIPGRPLPDLTNLTELLETTAWSEGTTAWSQGTTAWSQGDHCLIPEIPLSNPREITS